MEKDNYFAESYVPGEEFSVEAYTINNETIVYGICKTKTNFEKSFVESSHLAGLKIPNSLVKERIEEKLNTIFKHIDFQWGISHIEIKIYEERVCLHEFHPARGGDIPQAIMKSWDNNFLSILKKSLFLIKTS